MTAAAKPDDRVRVTRGDYAGWHGVIVPDVENDKPGWRRVKLGVNGGSLLFPTDWLEPEVAHATALDHLLDAIRAAARAGHHAQLTLHGNTEAAALRAWADRHGFPVTTEQFSRIESGLRWTCDQVDLPSRCWIAAHWDDEPATGGAS